MSDLVKDRECIYCGRFFECNGKPRGSLCVSYEERKEENGREKNVDKKGYR